MGPGEGERNSAKKRITEGDKKAGRGQRGHTKKNAGHKNEGPELPVTRKNRSKTWRVGCEAKSPAKFWGGTGFAKNEGRKLCCKGKRTKGHCFTQ